MFMIGVGSGIAVLLNGIATLLIGTAGTDERRQRFDNTVEYRPIYWQQLAVRIG